MSKKDNMFRQCRLVRDLGEGRSLIKVSWIPARYAKEGRSLELMDPDGDWTDGWKVTEVGNLQTFENIDRQRDAQRDFGKKLDKKKRR